MASAENRNSLLLKNHTDISRKAPVTLVEGEDERNKLPNPATERIPRSFSTGQM